MSARALRLLASFALSALLLAACSRRDDNGSPEAPPTTTPTTSATAAPAAPTPSPGTAGCGRALPAGVAAGQTAVRTLTSGGRERSYRLHVPGAYSPSKAMPLVLNFHGLGSTAVEQEIYSGLVPLSDRETFVLVSPQGISNSWLLAPGVDDVAFTRDLVSALGADLCLDLARVYSTGISNGAFMSSTLACVAHDLVAAIAPVAGVGFRENACGAPVPVLAFHGTEDKLVPFTGGTLPTSGSYAGVMPMMDGWAKRNGCSPVPNETAVSSSVKRVEYQGCGADTAIYVVTGGGHTWPGAIDVPRLGPTTHEISATELMWAFFQSHPKK